MLMLEAAAAVGLVAVLVFALAMALLTRSTPGREPVGSGHWRATHYEADGRTRVVVQKISAAGAHLLDEHLVAELQCDDADFDARFIDAMNTARQRQSLFEAEES